MDVKIDKIIKSKRKTIGLEVTPDAKIIVHSPKNATKRQINDAIEKKSAWILEKQQLVLNRRNQNPAKRCEDGETFLLFSKPLTLIFDDSSDCVTVRGEYLSVPARMRANAQSAITAWYKAQALTVIRERADFYAAFAGVSYKSLKITSALKRWGSCSGSGRLCFTWRLAMAPVEMIDYVVVHELSHILHHDHSKAFWSSVENFMPDYKVRREWFRENSALLRPDFFVQQQSSC